MIYLEYQQLKKLLKFTLKEKRIIKELGIPPDAFIPLLFSIRFGGDWSFVRNSDKFMAVKEKITKYDEKEKVGCTIEIVYLFLNPRILKEEGTVYRLEKCGDKGERKLVKRPYQIIIGADYIIKASLDPLNLKIKFKRIKKPVKFEGSGAYGASHEMEHLSKGQISGRPFWEFEYEIEK
ncbi:MAG: RimK/LysX family protein [Methanothermobacter sp.]